ncbi:hypothetical protein EMCG_05469 [[Emmonsia] crescens]|uniref:Uncharacterized protein n=1 Tax=[Emmonsia] crescens TaxID=73230 RepID=A0A0G2IXI3_9EURO|nr:hypothetical protein EMCG_05469 [Emmonsia crescens UAMH 3008]
MPSGDLILMAAADSSWMREWGDKAQIKREMYAVLVKNAPMAGWDSPERTIESIYKQNSTLCCKTLIHKVDKITVRQQKPQGSIIINVTAPHGQHTDKVMNTAQLRSSTEMPESPSEATVGEQ